VQVRRVSSVYLCCEIKWACHLTRSRLRGCWNKPLANVFRSNPNPATTAHSHPETEPKSWTALMIHHQSSCDGVTVTRTSLSLTVNKDPTCRNGRRNTRQLQPRTAVWQSTREDASLFRSNPEDYIFVWPRCNSCPGAPCRQSNMGINEKKNSVSSPDQTIGRIYPDLGHL